MFSKFQILFPTDNYKKYSKRTNPKITILEISVNKIQPEIIKFKILTCFKVIQSYYNKVETRKYFRFYYFWLYFVYQNFQNGYFQISLLVIL